MARSPSRRDERSRRHERDRDNYGRHPRGRDLPTDHPRDHQSYRPVYTGGGPTGAQRGYEERGYGSRRDSDRYIRDDRRDRSRDRIRKRSREISPGMVSREERARDGRDREGHRDARDRDDQARDPKRPRRGSSPPHLRSGGYENRDEPSYKSGDVKDKQSPASGTSGEKGGEPELQQVKLGKVAAWKVKLEEKRRAKAGTPSALDLLNDTDRKPSDSSSVASPAPLSESADSPARTIAKTDEQGSASRAPSSTKFDQAAIKRRAQEKIAKYKKEEAVGASVVIPKLTGAEPTVNRAKLAEPSKLVRPDVRNGTPHSKPMPGGSKVTGFGLSKATADRDKPDKSAQRAGISLEDEDVKNIKLVKLPALASDELTLEDASQLDDADDADAGDDDFDEAADGDDDKAAATAARATAEKRAQEAQTATVQHDVVMTAATNDSRPIEAAAAGPDKMDTDEDIDPLDAFMNQLEVEELTSDRGVEGKPNRPQLYDQDGEGDSFQAVGDTPHDILAMTRQRKKVKDIPNVDHAKMQYDAFRKAFYTESVELASMSDEEVLELRFKLDEIKVHGKDVPKPVLTWSQCALNAQTLNIITSLGYEKPTSIQSQALPALMSGRDVIGVAKTGSGKTLAFLLPMFRHIKDQRPLDPLDGPIGFIMAPTRELAKQIVQDCGPFLKALNLRAVCAHGGTPIKDQIGQLKKGAEIVVCTPGRIIDLLAANSGRVTNLRRVTYLVLDEADRMFDMGFEPQITKILQNVRPDRQTVLFSATFPPKMEGLARKALTKPVQIEVGGRSVVAKEITQMIEVRSESSKFNRLLELIGGLLSRDEDARTLVFVEKQETADLLLKWLLKAQYPSHSIHGGKDQMDRDSAIEDFKAGVVPILLATSLAARGLDVKQLKLVVNYDCPNHIEDYVHRAGRTGRAGNTGTAVTFVTEEQDRFASFLVKALKQSGQEAPEALKELEASFKEKLERGEVRKVGSGFSGQGLDKYDNQRDANKQREKAVFRTGDENEEVHSKDMEKTKDTSRVDQLLAKATGKVAPTENTPPPQISGALKPGLSAHLDAARKVLKSEKPAVAAGGAKNPLDQVQRAIANINSRHGAKGATTRSGIPIDNKGPDAGAFHSTIEINDFDQKARWAVTNRTNVAKILDATGTSITSKGNFYPRGVEPEQGQPPKLYILVEGDTEVVVENAMNELIRLLREGTNAAMEAEARAPAGGGRYSVV